MTSQVDRADETVDRLDTTTQEPTGGPAPVGPSRSRLRTVVRVVLAVAVAAAAVQIATFDIRERPLVGDEASHMLQALSLAYDANLSYDMGDLDRFEALDWIGARRPNGVFFQQYRHGFAFAKPYGWSASAAPFVRVFGPVPGFALASAALFLVLVASAAVIGRRVGRWGPEVAVASVLASVTWLYGFSAHTEMFLAAVTGLATVCIIEYQATRRMGWLIAACALSGFLVSEKPLFALALAPVLLVLTWKQGFRHVLVGGAATVVAFLVAIVPYLFYSDFDSWNPYAGDRYYRADGVLPFAPEAPPFSSYRLMTESAENFDPEVVFRRITSDPDESVEAMALELVGRHTGMLVFMPLTLAMLVLALWRRRGAPNRADAIAVGVGLVLYLAVYAFVYPHNYHGGEHSLGNRYLVQIAPIALAGLAFAKPKPRVLAAVGLAGVTAAVLFLGPHFAHPSDAFVRLERRSAVRDLLPEETKVWGVKMYRCGIPAIMWGPFIPDAEERDAEIREWERCVGVAPST